MVKTRSGCNLNNYRFDPRSSIKILAVTGLLCLTLLAGCSNTEPADKSVTITFWHGINPPENRDIFQKLVNKFNQDHSDIEVEALYVGQPDAQLPKILAANS